MIDFQIVTDQFLILLDQIPLQLDSEGIKEIEDGERCVCVGGGGDYSREAINRGTAGIRGNTIKERKRYKVLRLNVKLKDV